MAKVVYSPTRTGRLIHQLVIGLIAIVASAAGASAQTTVTLSTPGSHINADLRSRAERRAWWTQHQQRSGVEGQLENYTRRIMLKFDSQNFIPANAVIQSARLYLVLKTAESAENRALSAFHVVQSFATGQTNWYYTGPAKRGADRAVTSVRASALPPLATLWDRPTRSI